MKQQSKAALVLAVATLLWGSNLAPLTAGEFEWSGDIRVRNESFYAQQINRNRLRLRTGFKTELTDNVDAYVRFATSTFQGSAANSNINVGENNSTNQNFVNASAYPMFVDLAYITYRPSMVERLKIHAGKMKNFFASTPLLWDADTNPDGLGEEYNMGAFIFRAAQWSQITNMANNTGFYSYQLGWQGDILELYLSNYVDTSSGTISGANVGTIGNYLDYLAVASLGARAASRRRAPERSP
jgi:hypothetical protein